MGAVVVLGASGFIGRHLMAALVKDNVEVIAMTRAAGEDRLALAKLVNWIEISDFSLKALELTLSKCEISAIINLAAYGVYPADRDSEKSFEINVKLPASLAQIAAKHNAVFVNTGSSAEYSSSLERVKLDEASPLQTHSVYGSTKAAGGLLARSLSSANGGRCAHLRLFNVYGEGEARHRLFPALIEKLRQQQRVPLSQGSQIRDFIHVSDAVSAILKAKSTLMDKAGPFQATWNVGTGCGTSVAGFARTVCKLAGQPDTLLGFGDIALRQDDTPFLVANTHAALEDFGWAHTLSVEQGVALAISNMSQ